MPINKKQLKRLVLFVNELKENRFPNQISFMKKLKLIDMENNENISCSAKTVQRDIQVLKSEFNAPIEFDREENGYFLTREDWCFYCPILQESELLALAVGSHVAQNIFPQPISSAIADAFSYHRAGSNEGEFEHLERLVISSGLNVEINSEIFNDIYKAWKERFKIEIEYFTMQNSETNIRVIEPQILFFHKGAWHLKAFCHKRGEPRVFSVQRIKSLTVLDEKFKLRPDISLDLSSGTPFSHACIERATLQCSALVAKYLQEQPFSASQVLSHLGDDSYKLDLYNVDEFKVISWVMSWCGEVKLLTPHDTKQKIIRNSEKLLGKHSL